MGNKATAKGVSSERSFIAVAGDQAPSVIGLPSNREFAAYPFQALPLAEKDLSLSEKANDLLGVENSPRHLLLLT